MVAGGPPVLLLWTASAAGWWWLVRNARGRTRLLQRLSARHGGFLRRRFSWLLAGREAVEVTFIRVIGGAPVTFRVGFALPFAGARRAATVCAITLRDLRLGDGAAAYGPGDLATGRGLFVGGANLTASYARFLAALPPRGAPTVSWAASGLSLSVPALLGEAEEYWVDRCLAFLSEAAAQVLGAAPR